VTAVLDATSDLSIIQRCIIVIVITGVAYRFRSAVDKGVDSVAAGLGKSMRGVTSPGGGGGGAFVAGAAAAAGGAALAGPLSVRPRQVATTAIAASGSAAAGARRGVTVPRGVGAQAVRGTRAAGASTRAIVAPLTLPQRARTGATDGTARVRNRLDQARRTRQQWAANIRHPISASRSGRDAAQKAQNDTFDWM
jgi:hypothetical protein